jgi:hypothetical protein
MIQLLLILLILVCLSYILLQKEHFYNESVGNLKVVGGNQGIKLTWIKPSTDHHDYEYNKYYIILSSKFSNPNKTKINVYVHKTTDSLVEYYIKELHNDIIYRVDIIPQVNDSSYGKVSTTQIRTDPNSPLCLSTNKCNVEGDNDDTDNGEDIDNDNDNGGDGCNDKCREKIYNNVKQMIVNNRIINVEGNYTINIM